MAIGLEGQGREMPAIEYRDVVKRYERAARNSVDHVSATVNEGELVTILGSSGCGKTTLLKMTNRLIEPSSGQVLLFGEDVATLDAVEVRRRMGYVIQQVGLFPHMTIGENVGIMPKLEGWERSRIDARVTELLELVGLDPLEYRDRYPSELSGGQQQRVGLARALVADPRVMLLDEPFGAIDAITRLNLQRELRRLHEASGGTFLLVTHDINEAFSLGDRVMVMNGGRLLQFDTPQAIVRDPADAFVRDLVDSAREHEAMWQEVRS